MAWKNYTEEQIIAVLKEAEAGSCHRIARRGLQIQASTKAINMYAAPRRRQGSTVPCQYGYKCTP